MSLSSLPTELVEQITLYLDLPNFRSLRLTSIRLHTSTTHPFKCRFFATQYLTWNRTSLQQLVDISSHCDLGDALQCLVIDATPYHSLELWKMSRRSADAGHMTPVTDDEDGSKLIRHLNREYKELQQQANDVAKWFTETRFDNKCLTTVFTRTTELESITFAYQGMGVRYSKFYRRYCDTSQCEMSRPFVSTMSAIATSRIKIQRIEIHQDKDYGAISIGRLESLAPSLRYFDAAFETLTTLQLTLRDWRSPDSGFALERHRAPFVVRFLAKCRNVRVLELDCYSELEGDLFGDLARTCHFDKLERCVLDLFRINRVCDLLTFLAPSSASLLALTLQRILLADAESTWTDLFVALADSTSCLQALEALMVGWLFILGEKRVSFYDTQSAPNCLQFEGKEWRGDLKMRGHRYVEPDSPKGWELNAMLYPFLEVKSFAGMRP